MHPKSLQVIQTYTYTEIVAVSFTADDQSGIVMHLRNGRALKKSRLFFIQSSRRHGNGRSDLLTLMREHYETLGLELKIQESCGIPAYRNFVLRNACGPANCTLCVTLNDITNDLIAFSRVTILSLRNK